MRRGGFLWSGLLPALAFAGGIPAKPEAPLDFELSDGRQFVRLSGLTAKPTLVNFWRADCPPCVREIPLLANIARSGTVRVIMVAVQKPSEALALEAPVRAMLAAPMIQLTAPSQPQGLLARFGNPVGAIPHTLLLDSERRVCAFRTGEIDERWAAAGMKDCR